MDLKILTIFVVAFIVLLIVGFLLKSFLKIIITFGIILVLFGAGFLWGPNDWNEKLGLNNILSSSSMETVNDIGSKLEDKREENAVIEEGVLQSIQDKFYDFSKTIIEFCGNIVIKVFDSLKSMFPGDSNNNTIYALPMGKLS